MRLIVSFICLAALSLSAIPSRAFQTQQGPGVTTYNHLEAGSEALACSDPDQQSGCKIYFAGFAHALDLLFATDASTKDAGIGVCGDTSELLYEFMQEVKTRPKLQKEDTNLVLSEILARDHDCRKIRGRIHNPMSAGRLIDICHTGDVGFSNCSLYVTGFLGAVLFVSEQTGTPILCGDQRLVNPVSVTQMLNDGLQADYRLRSQSAVVVMLDEIKAQMPCTRK